MNCHAEGSQKGSALALVMWLLSAMSVLVAGAVSISRQETALAGDGAFTSRAFYLGKGVAHLIMAERALISQAAAGGDAVRDRPAGMTHRFEIGGASVEATLIPASGFVALRGSDKATWLTLLTKVGDLDPSAAQLVADRFSGHAGNGGDLTPAGVTGFAAYRYKYGGGTGEVAHVESLLGVQGMTRNAYDRIYKSIAPVSGAATPDLTFATEEIRQAFEDAPSDPSLGTWNEGAACIEVLMDFGSGDRFTQRLWVRGRDSASGAVEFLRVELPARLGAIAG